tara:strand:+ start:3798 stop:4067 length:270 start_codon:yes stop_codon:yes gene_type:complete
VGPGVGLGLGVLVAVGTGVIVGRAVAAAWMPVFGVCGLVPSFLHEAETATRNATPQNIIKQIRDVINCIFFSVLNGKICKLLCDDFFGA